MLWRIYKRTGNVEDYTNYKEALNLATTELRKSKRTFEKMDGNIKHESKKEYAYVRSKQTFQDMVALLENNSDNIISDVFLMPEVLNEHFSSVFLSQKIPVHFQFQVLSVMSINQII